MPAPVPGEHRQHDRHRLDGGSGRWHLSVVRHVERLAPVAELGVVTRRLLSITRTLRDDRVLAERICQACVEGIDVDGAAISLLTSTAASPGR